VTIIKGPESAKTINTTINLGTKASVD